MNTVRIIPCLDVYNGRVVKGVRFTNLRDAGDPMEIAKAYENAGADELIFLDIAASNEGKKTMLDVVKKVTQQTCLPLTVGGGINQLTHVREILESGASKASIGSAAFLVPGLISEASNLFGSQRIVVAIDAKGRVGGGWDVYISGGMVNTGKDVVEWAIELEKFGAGEILLTSMDGDGTKDGYDVSLTKAVSQTVNIPVIASGGAGKLEHFYDVIVQGGADAVLAASVFHFKEIEIQEVKNYLEQKGILVNKKGSNKYAN